MKVFWQVSSASGGLSYKTILLTMLRSVEMSEVKGTNKQQIFVGDVFKTNCHGDITVISYNHANDILVEFDNGYQRSATSGNIQKGKVKDPTAPTRTHAKRPDNYAIIMGKKYLSNEGFYYTPFKYINASEILVSFESGYVTAATSQNIRQGNVADNLSPNKNGVGIIGEVSGVSKTKAYQHWSSMLSRGYCERYKATYPTYKDVTVCKEWHNFTVFSKWCDGQPNFNTEGSVLDKDILVKGNKMYSPETCVFVPHKVNSLFVKADATRGKYPIGVYFSNKDSCLRACVRIDGKNKSLGMFSTVQDAFNAYKVAKEDYIKANAELFKNVLDNRCYEAMINYQVEITD
jgi:hypothetical protein